MYVSAQGTGDVVSMWPVPLVNIGASLLSELVSVPISIGTTTSRTLTCRFYPEGVHPSDPRQERFLEWRTLQKFRTATIAGTNVILPLKNSYICCLFRLSITCSHGCASPFYTSGSVGWTLSWLWCAGTSKVHSWELLDLVRVLHYKFSRLTRRSRSWSTLPL